MVTPKKLIDGVTLPNAVAPQYTSPALISTLIKKFTATNTDAAAGHAITIYVCANGVAPAAANLAIDARVIGPLQTEDVTELINQLISAGGTLQCFADDATHIQVQASGVQLS